ncbi:glycosyltransferase [Cesiribacter sp. SM1]|uniref:CgeB family protein n=1 Tax=Cesiribacter sp. SM1 TaxID=2861196 RepID=UPI001CD7AD4F|nr:glycosyltransferase [Cesiribacter sp. SM1]
MKIKLFYHSLISCWNHGNAHFLRGVVADLVAKGHQVEVFEPSDGWSYENMVKEHGGEAVSNFKKNFPLLKTNFYFPEETDYAALVQDADLVIVHEWNTSELVSSIGELKDRFGYTLLFHDTHHRSVSAPEEMSRYDLSKYDGVLAFGEVIKDIYLQKGWAKKVWTWHEAADTRHFYPRATEQHLGDLVWIGNWGDDEREEELEEFLIRPVEELGLKATIYGVRYPERAKKRLKEAGIEYKGWLPNYMAPVIFSQYSLTVHVPRRYYTQSLPGIPTIRPFEAMACGIPLISSPWEDAEGLFEPGKDFLMVKNGEEMKQTMQELLTNPYKARELTVHGLHAIRSKHSCAHRVNELMQIYEELQTAKLERV